MNRLDRHIEALGLLILICAPLVVIVAYVWCR